MGIGRRYDKSSRKCYAIFLSNLFLFMIHICFCLSFIFHLATLKHIISLVLPFSPCESRCFSPPCVLLSPFFHILHILLSTIVSSLASLPLLNFLLSALTPYLRYHFFFIIHITNFSPIYHSSRLPIFLGFT